MTEPLVLRGSEGRAVSHGAIVPELAHAAQERVARAVGTACGVEIDQVDLTIEEIA